jgi:indole-3-glycerol phosphate synthase
MNKVVLALNAIAQNLSLLLDVAGSIDRRLEEQNKLIDVNRRDLNDQSTHRAAVKLSER